MNSGESKKKKTGARRTGPTPGSRPARRASVRLKKAAGPLLLITGEHSGDLLAADLVHELRLAGYEDFFGTGGDAMAAEGVELLEHVREMTVIGFIEAFKAYRRLKALADRVLEEAVRRGAVAAVLVDYPGFNLRFARMLKAAGIRVIYLVSPQIWAWHYSRIKTIRENVDLMLTLFPFEKDMYAAEGVEAECIGHPLIRRIPRRLRREEPLPVVRRPPDITVGLLPGSRRSEVSRLLGPMLGAARLIRKRYPRARILLAGADENLEPLIESVRLQYADVDVEYHRGRTLRIMEESDVAIVASGTATLETAYFRTPMILLYRVGWFNFLFGTLVIRTRFIGIVNILARRQASLELLQSEVTPENIFQEFLKITTDREYRDAIVAELDHVRRTLGRGNPASVAAGHIERFLSAEGR